MTLMVMSVCVSCRFHLDLYNSDSLFVFDCCDKYRCQRDAAFQL